VSNVDLLWIGPLMLLLLVLKGFFSGSEIALVNADKIKLGHAAKQGRRGPRLVLELFRRPERVLTTTLVGTNVTTVTLTTLGTHRVEARRIETDMTPVVFLLVSDLRLKDHVVQILAIERGGDFQPVPRGEDRCQAGDRLVVFGRARAIEHLFEPEETATLEVVETEESGEADRVASAV
jgi:hypothetical protein